MLWYSQHILEFCKYLGVNSLITKLTFSRNLLVARGREQSPETQKLSQRFWFSLPHTLSTSWVNPKYAKHQCTLPGTHPISSPWEKISVCDAGLLFQVGMLGGSSPSLRADLCHWSHPWGHPAVTCQTGHLRDDISRYRSTEVSYTASPEWWERDDAAILLLPSNSQAHICSPKCQLNQPVPSIPSC